MYINCLIGVILKLGHKELILLKNNRQKYNKEYIIKIKFTIIICRFHLSIMRNK